MNWGNRFPQLKWVITAYWVLVCWRDMNQNSSWVTECRSKRTKKKLDRIFWLHIWERETSRSCLTLWNKNYIKWIIKDALQNLDRYHCYFTIGLMSVRDGKQLLVDTDITSCFSMCCCIFRIMFLCLLIYIKNI